MIRSKKSGANSSLKCSWSSSPTSCWYREKIHLIGCDGVFLVLFHIDLVDGLLQRGKVLFDGLVHQHIAVCQVKDLVYRFALQKPVDDLECGVGFAGSGGHHQQQPFLSPGDGVNSPVDGDPLVVTWRVGSLAGKIGLYHGRLLSGRQPDSRL